MPEPLPTLHDVYLARQRIAGIAARTPLVLLTGWSESAAKLVSPRSKRCTRVVRIFPYKASCLRLVSAILMEISEGWETPKTYLSVDAS